MIWDKSFLIVANSPQLKHPLSILAYCIGEPAFVGRQVYSPKALIIKDLCYSADKSAATSFYNQLIYQIKKSLL
jgi:two-component SAPR family response regulator